LEHDHYKKMKLRTDNEVLQFTV